MKNTPVIIEITDSHIKLLQLKASRPQPVVTLCDVKALQEFSDTELTNHLVTLTRSKNVQSDQIIFVMPRRYVLFKFMNLPSQNVAEIKKMARLQLVNQIPYNIEDVVFDCQIIETDKTGYSQVLAIILHKEVFERYAQIFKKAGLHLSRAVLSSFGINAWLNVQQMKDKSNAEGTTAIINLDVVSSEICFCSAQKVVYSRHVNYGSKDLGVDNLVALISQIETSIKVYQTETKRGAISRCLIISSLAEASVLRSKLESEFKIPVSLMSGLEHILIEKKADMSTLKNQMGISLTALIGLGLADSKALINLAPQEVQEKKRTSLMKMELIKSAVLFLGVLLLAAAIPGKKQYEQKKLLSSIQEKINLQDPLVKDAQQKTELINAVKTAVADRIIVSEVMAEVNRLMTEDISLRSINLDEKGTLSIQGYGQTNAGVNNFQGSLGQSQIFKEVSLEFATKRMIFNVNVVDFKIVAQLKEQNRKDKRK